MVMNSASCRWHLVLFGSGRLLRQPDAPVGLRPDAGKIMSGPEAGSLAKTTQSAHRTGRGCSLLLEQSGQGVTSADASHQGVNRLRQLRKTDGEEQGVSAGDGLQQARVQHLGRQHGG